MLYATYGDRINQLLLNLPESSDKLKIIIVHQVDDVCHNAQHLFSHRSDVKYFMMLDKGVTKSRNFALQQATADIILFCDDDVLYENFFDELIELYEKNPLISGITLNYSTPKYGISSKFKNKPYIHTLRTILSVGTIEVSVRLSSVRTSAAIFPEELGAGAKFYCCDEPVFLSRLIKCGFDMMYFPLSVGVHPDISSGLEINNYHALFSRLIAFRHIYGYFGGTAFFYLFCVKNFYKLSPKLLLISIFSIFNVSPR